MSIVIWMLSARVLAMRRTSTLRSAWRILLLIAVVGIVVAGCAGAALSPVIPAAGLVRRDYNHSTRSSWNGSSPRPVVALIWYPTDVTAPAETLSIGPPGRPLFLAGVASPGVAINPVRERYPLVVLSHGTGGSAVQLAWLAIPLARQGYVVAALNHHGNTGTEPRYDARGFLLYWERARDVSVAIDRLLADPLFGPRIDRERIGAAGFSLGGYTVLALAGAPTDLQAYETFCASAERDFTCEPQPEMPTAHAEFTRFRAQDPATKASLARSGDSYRDERIRAVAALAPALGRALTPASLSRIDIPVLVISAERDSIAPPRTNGEFVHSAAPRSQIRRLEKAGHYTFLSPCTLFGVEQLRELCVEATGATRTDLQAQVIEAVGTFFKQTLHQR